MEEGAGESPSFTTSGLVFTFARESRRRPTGKSGPFRSCSCLLAPWVPCICLTFHTTDRTVFLFIFSIFFVCFFLIFLIRNRWMYFFHSLSYDKGEDSNTFLINVNIKRAKLLKWFRVFSNLSWWLCWPMNFH